MVYAFAWSSGLIQIGPKVPDGALPIMKGRKALVEKRMSARARHAYDGSLLVPGVPEAADEIEAVDALKAFRDFANAAPVRRAR